MAAIIVVIECDYIGYKPFTAGICHYDHKDSVENIRTAVEIVASDCTGKAAFLIHTSPFIRRNYNDVFFTSPEYLLLWKDVVQNGGEIGLHLHEEEPDSSCLYYGYLKHLRKITAGHVKMLSDEELKPTCESTGFFGTNEWLIPVLEENDLLVNLDNIGSLTQYTSVNWAKAPIRPYFASRTDITREGDSRVLIIPIGATERCRGEDGMIVTRNSLRYLRSLWKAIFMESGQDVIFSVWIEASKIRRDAGKIKNLIRYLKSEGAEFFVPSEIYSRCVRSRI